MTPELEARRGEEARQLLEHPLLAEAFALVEQNITQAWQDSPARDHEGRESLWLQLKLLRKVRGELETVVETGKVARATLAQRAAQALRSAGRTLSND